MTTFTSAKALNEPTVLVEFEGEPVRVPAGLKDKQQGQSAGIL